MNRLRLLTATLLAACVALLAACGSDDDAAADTTAGDCLITGAVLGTLNCYQHTLDSEGQDSTYTVTVQGYYYPLSIDHVNGRVYNADSLPVGTDPTRVVFSSFSVSGIAAIASLYDGHDTIFTRTDSTDFSTKRYISVYSRNGNGKRTYEFDLRVHREDADTFRWQKAGTDVALAGLTHTTLLATGSTLTLWGQRSGQAVVMRRSGDVWTESATTGDFDTEQVTLFGSHFYSLSGGAVVRSADGLAWTAGEEDWNSAAAGFTADRLVAAGSACLYALSDGCLYGTRDGWDWTAQTLDEPQYFPNAGWTACHSLSAVDAQVENLVLTGQRDGQPVVWKKVTDLTGHENFPWTYLPADPANAYSLPALADASMVAYDDAAVILGRNADGCNVVLVSRDQGRTWKDSEVAVPEEMALHDCRLTTDGTSLWIVDCTAGTLWSGRFNRLGWADAN